MGGKATFFSAIGGGVRKEKMKKGSERYIEQGEWRITEKKERNRGIRKYVNMGSNRYTKLKDDHKRQILAQVPTHSVTHKSPRTPFHAFSPSAVVPPSSAPRSPAP